METKKKALGKGLEQLFSNSVIDFNSFEEEVTKEATEKGDVTTIPVNKIVSNPYQPRKTFDQDALEELASSIKEYGIVQPIIVKKTISGYELVAGERRTRAAKLAGLTEIPAIIKDFNDQEMMEIALIENIQREDLNPIEEAESFENIIKLRGYTQEEFANHFGKSRSYVTNIIGLLSLPREVKNMVSRKELSMGHARALSKLSDEDKTIKLAKRVIKEELSVRELESILKSSDLPKKNKIVREMDYHYGLYENVLRDKIGTKVKVSKNKVEIPFDSLKDLERILEILNIDIED